MLLSLYYLKDSVLRLSNFSKQLKNNSDIEELKPKFYGICIDMIFACEENFFNIGQYHFKVAKDTIIKATNEVKDSDNIEVMKNNTDEILKLFPEDYDYSSSTLENFKYDVKNSVIKYSPIENYNLQQIIKNVEVNNRVVNIIDPRCNRGDNVYNIKNNIPGSIAYGIEFDSYIAESAKEKVDHVAKGALIGSRISNEAFDIMISEPLISWTLTHTNQFAKQEKIFMQNTIKYLRPGGLMILLIPYFRMYKDLCLFVSKNLDNVHIRRLTGRDFYNKGLIAIVGTRSSKKEPNQDTYRLLRKLHTIDNLKDISEDIPKIVLPKDTIEIEVFRGSILDQEEMKNIVQKSGCLDAFWSAQDVEKLSENVKQPLLPFNIGQIGLVLTSGCLDGIVDEGNNNYHVIKGRVSKKSTIERDLNESGIEVNETVSNRVEINVFMANGEYKILA